MDIDEKRCGKDGKWRVEQILDLHVGDRHPDVRAGAGVGTVEPPDLARAVVDVAVPLQKGNVQKFAERFVIRVGWCARWRRRTANVAEEFLDTLREQTITGLPPERRDRVIGAGRDRRINRLVDAGRGIRASLVSRTWTPELSVAQREDDPVRLPERRGR